MKMTPRERVLTSRRAIAEELKNSDLLHLGNSSGSRDASERGNDPPQFYERTPQFYDSPQFYERTPQFYDSPRFYDRRF